MVAVADAPIAPGERQRRYARRRRRPVTRTIGPGIQLVLIPPGSFVMGCSTGESAAYPLERPHPVKLTRGFYLGSAPITQWQWTQVMGSNPSHFVSDGPESQYQPVENISWNMASEFCCRLTAMIERTEGSTRGGPVRLPTEAEWEYACRAGSDASVLSNEEVISMSWIADNSGDLPLDGNMMLLACKHNVGLYNWIVDVLHCRPHPIRLKRHNAWGLYDMLGNVSECCADWFGEYPEGETIDPRGPSSGEHRVMRGGDCGQPTLVCQAPSRGSYEPARQWERLGLRIALGLE